MENGEFVSLTEASFSPADASSLLYSSGVRSRPPVVGFGSNKTERRRSAQEPT